VQMRRGVTVAPRATLTRATMRRERAIWAQGARAGDPL
jgi:hypothetical protein